MCSTKFFSKRSHWLTTSSQNAFRIISPKGNGKTKRHCDKRLDRQTPNRGYTRNMRRSDHDTERNLANQGLLYRALGNSSVRRRMVGMKSSKRHYVGRKLPFFRVKRWNEENSLKYLEGTLCHLKEPRVAKVSIEVSNRLNHFSERIKYSVIKQQSGKNNVTRTMEAIYESKVFQEMKEKQNWVIPASQVLVTGLHGNEESMLNQVLWIIKRTKLPMDKDAARMLIKERIDGKSELLGLKTKHDHFGTQTHVSLIIPLTRLSHFVPNPVYSKHLVSMLYPDVFSACLRVADPDDGGRFPFTVQAWTIQDRHTEVVARLLLGNSMDWQALSDCLVTASIKITKGNLMTEEVRNRIGVVMERTKVSYGKNAKKWWTCTVLVQESEQQHMDEAIARNIIEEAIQKRGSNIVIMNGYKMLYVQGDMVITNKMFKTAENMEQFPWVLLNGTRNPPLTYILDALRAVGVQLMYIEDIQYTNARNFAQKNQLVQSENVIIKSNSPNMMIVLAQRWLSLGLYKQISPKGFVNLVYGQERQRQLTSYEIDQNETLGLLREIMSVDNYYASMPKCDPASLERYSADCWYREAAKRSYADVSGKKQVTPAEACTELRICIRKCFGIAPKEVILAVADESETMIQQVLQRQNQETIFREESFLQRLASTFTSVHLQENGEDLEESNSSEEMEIEYGKKGGSLFSRFNKFERITGSMQHDSTSFELTPGKGMCGYAAICQAIRCSGNKLIDVNPGYYHGFQGMMHLRDHIAKLCDGREIKQYRKTYRKFLEVNEILKENLNNENIMVQRYDLWLSQEDICNLIYAFKLRARGWIFLDNSYKCYVDNSEDSMLIHNIMLYNRHFYLHTSTLARKISDSERCEIVPGANTCGGMIFSEETAEELAISRRCSMVLQHRYLRSPQICEIVPPMHPVPVHGPEYIKYPLTENVPPVPNEAAKLSVDPNLEQYYISHMESNKSVSIQRRIINGVEVECLVADRFITCGSRIIPFVGALSARPTSVLAVETPLYSRLSTMKTFLDPMQVGFDTGYNLMSGINEVIQNELQPNPARYLRVRPQSLDPDIVNVQLIHVVGENSIWAQATKNIFAGEILWRDPDKIHGIEIADEQALVEIPSPNLRRASLKYPLIRFGNRHLALPSRGTVISYNSVTSTVIYIHKVHTFDIDGCNTKGQHSLIWGVTEERLMEQEMNDRESGNVQRGLIRQYKWTIIRRWLSCDIAITRFLLFNDSRLMIQQIYDQTYLDWNTTKGAETHYNDRRAKRKFGKEFSSDNAGDGPDNNDGIRVCFWNSNGHLTAGDTSNVQEIMKKYQLDILALSDVRLHARAAKYNSKAMRQGLRGYTISCLETSRSSYTRRGGARMNTMGGTLFIISPRCAANVIDIQSDSSGLGIIGYAKIIINGKKLCIISMYLPIEQASPGESTVFARLQSYLMKHKQSKSPQQYIKDTVMKWIAKAKIQGYSVMVGGDFNTKLDSPAGRRLNEWAIDRGLANVMTSLSEKQYLTHCYGTTPITSIDHMFADPELITEALEGYVISDILALEVSDHLPIMVRMRWDTNDKQEYCGNTQSPKRIELMQYDKKQLEEYAHVMQTWFEINGEKLEETSPSEGLMQLMKASVDATYELTKKKRNLHRYVGLRSDFKDGFSPFYYSLKTAYRMILAYITKLKNIPANARGRREGIYHREYIAESLRWAQENRALQFKDDEDFVTRLSRITEKLTELRLLLRPDLTKLEAFANYMRTQLHGRRRAEFRRRTNRRLAQMQDLYEQNRLGEMFRMINLKNKPDLDLSVLQTKSSVLVQPEEIHQQLTAHFADWYKIPTDLHPAAMLWQDDNFWQRIVNGEIFSLCNGQEHVAFQEETFLSYAKGK